MGVDITKNVEFLDTQINDIADSHNPDLTAQLELEVYRILPEGSEQDFENFKSFIVKYNRTYEIGSSEYNKRFSIFKESVERQKKLNSKRQHPDDAKYGVNAFSDLTPDEFAEHYLGIYQRVPASTSSGYVPSSKEVDKIPSKFSLEGKGVLTSVRDQGACGGCWAFSIVECMETQNALKTKKLISLSTQQLIDCARGGGDNGCKGGNICTTLAWMNDTKYKEVHEKDYPFKEKTGTCRNSSTGILSIMDYWCTDMVNHEDDMIASLYNHGPLAVAVDASTWQDYIEGVIQHHCSAMYINHAVQIVGYDKSGEIPYYIVRNSWGKDWGLNGYLHVKIGSNMCGIATIVGSLDV
ncbi:cathepsin O-like [Anneissia japonica]|uniref:cathepsin O-like n=1 Tax=Anneissia japonica TaxID=1529436 RepID=UPI00142555F9|nr:cathepsin O-like [Anneissia japonica]